MYCCVYACTCCSLIYCCTTGSLCILPVSLTRDRSRMSYVLPVFIYSLLLPVYYTGTPQFTYLNPTVSYCHLCLSPAVCETCFPYFFLHISFLGVVWFLLSLWHCYVHCRACLSSPIDMCSSSCISLRLVN